MTSTIPANSVPVELLKSGRPVLNKVLWSLLIFLFPIGGLIIYYLFADRSAASGGYEPVGA